MGAKSCANTVLFRISSQISPKKAKNADCNDFFGLIPFLKTDAVLNHLPESIKEMKKKQNTRKKRMKQCRMLRSL